MDTKNTSRTKGAGGSAKQIGLTVGVVAVLCVAMNLLVGGRFLSFNNLLSVLTSSVVTAFVAIGLVFIFTMGIMDLSIGSVMILASNVGGILAVELGLGYFGLIAGCIVVACTLLLFNMSMMRLTGIPPWIFGIGMTMVYEAIGAIYNVNQINAGRQAVSLGDVCRELGVPPWNVVVLVAGVVAAYFVFNRTTVGFGLRAVGSNAAIAKLMGIKVNRAILLAGLVGSAFIGVAAAVNLSYAGRVMPTTGLNSIANVFIPLAAFLLAKALQNIVNIAIGAAVSAFMITAIFNVLTLMGVPSGTWQQVVMGGCVLVCGIVSQRKFKGVVK